MKKIFFRIFHDLHAVALAFALGLLSNSALCGAELIEDFESGEVLDRIARHSQLEIQPGFKVELAEGFATSGRKSLHLHSPSWQSGIEQWPRLIMPFDRPHDMTEYDRIVLDLYNDAEGGDLFVCVMAETVEKMNLGFRRQTSLPNGYSRWVWDLNATESAKWPATLDRKNVGLLHIFSFQPANFNVYVDRMVLLKPGEPLPEPSREFVDGILKERVRRDFEPIEDSAFVTEAQRQSVIQFLEDPAVTADEACEFRQRIEKLKNEVAHLTAHDAFRKTCASDGLLVGMATSMEQMLPRDKSMPRVAKAFSVDLARKEVEAFQVIVSPAKGELRNCRVSVGALRRADGEILSAGVIGVGAVGYVAMTNADACARSYTVREQGGVGYRRSMRPPQLGWWPDPILDFLPSIDVAETDFNAFWVSVKCPEDQKPGLYVGFLTVSADGIESVSLPLTIRVRDFELPVLSPIPLLVSYNPWYRDISGHEFWRLKDDPEAPIHLYKKRLREWTDFLADHFVTIDNLYHPGVAGLRIDEWKHLKEQGRLAQLNLGYFNIDSPTEDAYQEWKKNELPLLKDSYEVLRQEDLLKYAYVYGIDERTPEYFPVVKKMIGDVRQACPGVPIATTIHDDSLGVESGVDFDWFIRVVGDYEGLVPNIPASRAAGHKVFWYTCDGPVPTFPNFYVHSQSIEGRLLMGAMAQRMKPDGYLMYQMTIWNSRRPITSGPYTDWEVVTMTDKPGLADWAHCGPDGRPVTTIRFENFRDGVEDLMYAKLLERKLAAHADRDDEWAKRAQAALAVPTRIMDSMTNYTEDPAEVYAWRKELADLIESE